MLSFAEKIEHTRIKSDHHFYTRQILPELEAVTSQVLASHAERPYSAIWVDDKGGRLPGLFVRRVIRNSGLEVPPTYFVMAGRKARNRYDYHKEPQFDRITPEDAFRGRGLIVSDTVGEGNAIGFLAHYMNDRFEDVDVATVALCGDLPRNSNVRNFMVGGVGRTAINNANAAFESVLYSENTDGTTVPRHLKNILFPRKDKAHHDHDHTYPTGGVEAVPAPGSIHAQRAISPDYRDVTVFARQRIYALADQFSSRYQ